MDTFYAPAIAIDGLGIGNQRAIKIQQTDV